MNESVPVADEGAGTLQADETGFIDAFLTASREGDFEAPPGILAPDIVADLTGLNVMVLC